MFERKIKWQKRGHGYSRTFRFELLELLSQKYINA